MKLLKDKRIQRPRKYDKKVLKPNNFKKALDFLKSNPSSKTQFYSTFIGHSSSKDVRARQIEIENRRAIALTYAKYNNIR